MAGAGKLIEQGPQIAIRIAKIWLLVPDRLKEWANFSRPEDAPQ